MSRLIEPLLRRVLGGRIPPPAECSDDSLPDGVVIRQGTWIPALGGLLARTAGPAAAVTLRGSIIVHPHAPLTRRLLAHELEHVRQWRQDRWFPLRYTWESVRHGYYNNRYEVEARAAAERAVSRNISENPETP